MNPRCISVTPQIEELHSKLVGETIASVTGLVELWQQDNNKDWDTYPTAKELATYKVNLRKNPVQSSVQSYSGDIKPSKDVIFVFGSNPEGRHGAGAAKVAREKFGAIRSQGEGLQGNAYALPTKDLRVQENKGLRSISPSQITKNISKMYQVALNNPDKKFMIAYRNIGDKVSLNGYSGNEMIDMFLNAGEVPSNVYFSSEWVSTGKFNKDFNPIKILDKAAFSANQMSTPQEQAKADLTLGVEKKRDRVNLISKLFSTTIDLLIEENGGTLNRAGIINKYTPLGIFQRVEAHFTSFLKAPMEERIQAKLNSINKQKGALNFPLEARQEKARQEAEYTSEEYQKVIDNFRVLAEEASLSLVENEKIRINPGALEAKVEIASIHDYSNDMVNEDSADTPGNRDLYTIEESFKDNWMTNYTLVSSFDSLSQKVRATLRSIPKLTQNKRTGRFVQEKDDLGYPRYLDVSYVHAVLIQNLRLMETADDLIPMLEELSKNQPWVKQVIILLQQNEVLFSQFYQNFRKDFVPYWIQRKKMGKNGTYYMETIEVNSSEGISSIIDDWRYTYESGTQLDEDSIYNESGELNKDNAQLGLELTVKLNDRLANLSKEQRFELVRTPELLEQVTKLLNMVGINPTESALVNALTNNKDDANFSFTDPIMSLLPSLNIIFSGVSKGRVKESKSDEGTVQGDLINTFSTAFKNIANLLIENSEGSIESSVRENGKSYYSHTSPNFMGTFMNKLQGKKRSEEEYQAMLEEEYGKYKFFKDDSGWRNEFLKELATRPEMRAQFKHKTLLNSNKVEYAKWDSLDYTTILWAEYFGDPGNATSDTQFAYYHLPMIADAQSAEFLRFRKYDNNSIIDEDGNKLTYKQILTEKLGNLLLQEVDRIALVIARDEEMMKGNPKIKYIKNFDIKRNSKDNSIVDSMGGAEFKFLPALNKLRVNGKPFLEEFENIRDNKTATELKEFIYQSIETIMDVEFEHVYSQWHSDGLFEELSNGSYKHMGVIGITNGQSQYNASLAKAMESAKSILGANWTNSMTNLLGALNQNKPVNTKNVNVVLNRMKELLDNAATESRASVSDTEAIKRDLNYKNYGKEALEQYFWNSTFATSQIIQLTATDLAYYGGPIDFQKRFKQVHSPALRLNTNSKYGRKIERTMYLKDSEIVSESINDIKEILQSRVDQGLMKKGDMLYILDKFKEVNWADAQAYRSISSYRAILDMSGQWTEEMQQAFENFEKGEWNPDDFDIIWQTKKPFVYSHIAKDSGIEGEGEIKVGVQNKNSEFLLLAMHSLIAGELGKSPKLKAINKFMENNKIDVIQFESAVKVGLQGGQDINNLNTEQAVIDHLEKALKPDGVEDKNVLHEISYEDYGIQVETPEHSIDAIQLIGTQIRKLISADMSNDPNLRITVNGKSLTKQEWLDLYNELNTENILVAFSNINDKFKDIKEVEAILQTELRGNARYGTDMIRACTLDENNQFSIPLFDPVISLQVQTLLNSIIKKNITKQTIRGGALIQVSSYGLSDDLKIVYEGEGTNKRIKYLECYMPAYSREFYEPLMKPGTNELDITKLPEDLRKLIGYRVPTEDKYSMAPLYIKGFLPQQNGSAIMLPAEITTLSGSDFDVDKLYIMLPEFKRIRYYNKAQFVEDLIKTLNGPSKGSEGYQEMKDSVFDAIKRGKESPEGSNDRAIYNTYMKNREKYADTSRDRLVKETYDMSKPAKEQSLGARNNALIDMMWGVLTNEDTAPKILNPGGFDPQKKAGDIVTVLNNMNKQELMNTLGVTKESDILKALENYKPIGKLASSFRGSLNPLSPLTQVYLHQQNMMGASLISIYANHNASHALLQSTDIGLNAEHGSFKLDGKTYLSLHSIMNDNQEFISKNTAGFLAAAVDNAKEAILATLNQNTLTADASMLLSRLGHSPLVISVLMNQPIIMEMTKKYFRESREGKSKNIIFDEVIKKYLTKANMTGDFSYNTYKNNDFNLNDLMLNILNQEEGESLKTINETSDGNIATYARNQVAVGYLFKRIMSSAEALSQLVQATRADSQNGAAGPTIADTQINLTKLTDFYKDVVYASESPLVNADVLQQLNVDNMNEDEIRNVLLESQLPYLQAFHTLGLEQSQSMLRDYFPQFTESFKEVLEGTQDEEGNKIIHGLRSYTKYNKLDSKTINNIYNDLLAYIMTKTDFFGTEVVGESIINTTDRRNSFINNFPKEFDRIREAHPEIAELEFIQRLRIVKANATNPVDTVVFNNVGRLSPQLKERFTRDWQSLLYMGPEAATLALNLFRYSFYRNGFAFGPSSFIHLAPNAVRQVTPDYLETIRSLSETTDDYSQFIRQYIYNHLDNRQLVPMVSEDTTIQFQDEESNIYDSITVEIDSRTNNKNNSAFTKEVTKIGDEITAVEFTPFIAKKIKGKEVYFELDTKISPTIAQYNRISPLGYANSFIEYEYGKDVSEIKSVIQRNAEETKLNAEDYVAYDSNIENVPEVDESMYSESAMKDAFSLVLGAELEINQSKGNPTFSPNTDFKDAEDNRICGPVK